VANARRRLRPFGRGHWLGVELPDGSGAGRPRGSLEFARHLGERTWAQGRIRIRHRIT
jgi:hypothetical protein